MSAIEESVMAALRELPPNRQQEVLDFAEFLKAKPRPPLQSLEGLEGLWAGQGIDISEEEITDLRKEMWANFPRDI